MQALDRPKSLLVLQVGSKAHDPVLEGLFRLVMLVPVLAGYVMLCEF